ncbi:MAG: phosphopantothenoylcysteine decarboxylase [Rubripirellula sp.]|nr:phosphopantothenoylcysteine decarboxylase [Rubripirellula sp.]
MSRSPATVLLAVGGGIAAYKSAVICSRLVQQQYEVRVVMTRSAEQFVGSATFAALSGQPVGTESAPTDRYPTGAHIELAKDLDLMVVAPATANLIGKFANGIADDLASTIYLQRSCPVLLAPAMSASMWSKSAVQRNCKQLEEDGCDFVGPEEGWLSCRATGAGRMSEPDSIVERVFALLR